MDATTIGVLAEMVGKSGPAFMFVAIWIAYKAGQTATRAVSALEDIRDSVSSNQPLMRQIGTGVEHVEKSNEEILNRLSLSDMKLAALVARRNP
jgi:hypothetical protein